MCVCVCVCVCVCACVRGRDRQYLKHKPLQLYNQAALLTPSIGSQGHHTHVHTKQLCCASNMPYHMTLASIDKKVF